MNLEYYTEVKDGKMSRAVSRKIAEELNHFEGKRIHIIVKRASATRSSQQNRLWWAYMTLIAQELGYTKDELHEIAKFKFLKREKVHEGTGEILQYTGSTSDLNKTEFADMVDRLIQWCAESFSIVLPAPGDTFMLDFYNDNKTEVGS